jgi:membrane fusion protein, macrolide-specific efflux system
MTKRTSAPRFVYALGALCAGAIAAAILVVGPASGSTSAQSRTVTVARGVVQSTVSGSGTLEPAKQIGADFANSGSLKTVYVHEGEHVLSGQLLAEIDPTSAESSLKSSELSLTDAEVKLEAALKGLTPEELHQSEVAATQAHTSVATAQRSQRQAEQTKHSDETAASNAVAQAQLALRRAEQASSLDATSQQDAVNVAIAQRSADQKAVGEAQSQLQEAKTARESERSHSPVNEQKLSSAESKVVSAETTLRSAEAKLTQDENSIVGAQNAQASGALKDQQSVDSTRNAVTNAKQSQSATKLKDEQAIAQARDNVTSAQQALQSTLAANAVKATPPTHATVVSAETSVQSAKLAVEAARQTLAETKLYAPATGIVAAVNSEVGQAVSGTGGGSSASSAGNAGSSESESSGGKSSGGSAASTSTGSAGGSASGSSGGKSGGGSAASTSTGSAGGSASSASKGKGGSASGGESSGASGSGANAGASASTASTSSGKASTTNPTGSTAASSTSSSSKPFIQLTDLSGFQLIVALSESEVGHVHMGQIASVTIEALEGRKFAAHVLGVAVLATSNSGVVSYNVTFQLDQSATAIRPGMSATAEVVVDQAEGVNVPTSAISAGSVTVVRGGKQVRQPVVTGLAGNSSTIILSGLKAGEQIALPVASSAGTSSLTSRLAGRLGGGGLGGGGLGGGGGGGGGGLRGGPPGG